MKKELSEKQKKLIKEFIRYFFVGGSAFLVDFGVLVLTREFIFKGMGETGILIATALGFIAGLIFNYILSILFVFDNAKEKIKGKEVSTFIIFGIIGIIGLGLTELGMWFGIVLFGQQAYTIVKVFVAAVVLLWNFLARKIIIFK